MQKCTVSKNDDGKNMNDDVLCTDDLMNWLIAVIRRWMTISNSFQTIPNVCPVIEMQRMNE